MSSARVRDVCSTCFNVSTSPGALSAFTPRHLLNMKAQNVPTRRSERMRKSRTLQEALKNRAVVNPAPQWYAHPLRLFLALIHVQA
jgi:hypothetical protein